MHHLVELDRASRVKEMPVQGRLRVKTWNRLYLYEPGNQTSDLLITGQDSPLYLLIYSQYVKINYKNNT